MTLLDEETRQLSNHGRVQWMGRVKREKGHIGGMIRQDLLDGGICENNWASIVCLLATLWSMAWYYTRHLCGRIGVK